MLRWQPNCLTQALDLCPAFNHFVGSAPPAPKQTTSCPSYYKGEANCRLRQNHPTWPGSLHAFPDPVTAGPLQGIPFCFQTIRKVGVVVLEPPLGPLFRAKQSSARPRHWLHTQPCSQQTAIKVLPPPWRPARWNLASQSKFTSCISL